MVNFNIKQMLCTTQLPYLSYSERLKKVKFPVLAYRRLRGAMIKIFKIVKVIYDNQ